MHTRVIAERPPQQRRKPYGRYALLAGLALMGVWLAVQIARQGLADFYAQRNPELALKWDGDSTDALVALAQKELLARDIRAAAFRSRRAIELMPMKASAASTFGMVLTKAGRPKQADRIMTLAGKLGWRDGLAQLWLFQHRLAQRRYSEAFDRADAVARWAYELWPLVFRATAAAGANRQAQEALVRKLRQNPPWRRSFFEFLSADSNTNSIKLDGALLQELARGSTPPSKEEITAYVQRLIREGKWAGAASALQELAGYGARPHIYNGDFERGAGIAPFDWQMGPGVGWTPSISAAPERRGKALRIEYDGFSSPQPVQQTLVLRPGNYLLLIEIYEQTLSGADKLTWVVNCPGSAQPVARLPSRSQISQHWQQERAAFTIPDNCPSQLLQLVASPGDRHTSVVVWYDNLRIVPQH